MRLNSQRLHRNFGIRNKFYRIRGVTEGVRISCTEVQRGLFSDATFVSRKEYSSSHSKTLLSHEKYAQFSKCNTHRVSSVLPRSLQLSFLLRITAFLVKFDEFTGKAGVIIFKRSSFFSYIKTSYFAGSISTQPIVQEIPSFSVVFWSGRFLFAREKNIIISIYFHGKNIFYFPFKKKNYIYG